MIKPYDAEVAQMNAKMHISNRKMILPQKKHIIAAKNNGQVQYPSTHTLWKKEMLPPSKTAFTVTTAAPHQTIMKISENTNADWLVDTCVLNTLYYRKVVARV